MASRGRLVSFPQPILNHSVQTCSSLSVIVSYGYSDDFYTGGHLRKNIALPPRSAAILAPFHCSVRFASLALGKTYNGGTPGDCRTKLVIAMKIIEIYFSSLQLLMVSDSYDCPTINC